MYLYFFSHFISITGYFILDRCLPRVRPTLFTESNISFTHFFKNIC